MTKNKFKLRFFFLIFFVFWGNLNAQAAVRGDSTSDDLIYDTSAPSGDFTIMMWVYIVTDTNTFAVFMYMGEDTLCGGTSYINCSIWFGVGGDGTTLSVFALSDVAERLGGSNLSTATWYHVALVGNTGPGEALTLYLNGVSDDTGTTGSASPYSAERVRFFLNPDVENFNGRIAAFKLYNAQLTQAEILQEMRHIRPVRTANLWQWAPLWGSGDVNDYSGNGRNFTAANLSTEDGPPVGW